MSTTPNPDEVTAELALNRALRWIDRPRDASAWLWIGGRAGSGRTALLREVVARHPGAAYVDCAGRSAEEVARELATALGIAATDSFNDDIAAVARRISDDPVVVLANTQWAGRLRTSREPERVVDRVARTLITFHPRGLRMRLLVEVDDAPGRVDELGGRHLTLQGGFESMTALAEPDEDAALPSALRALALAEHRFVPLPVWSLLCSALGQEVPESRLESLLGDPAARDWIHRTDNGTGTPLISFKQVTATWSGGCASSLPGCGTRRVGPPPARWAVTPPRLWPCTRYRQASSTSCCETAASWPTFRGTRSWTQPTARMPDRCRVPTQPPTRCTCGCTG